MSSKAAQSLGEAQVLAAGLPALMIEVDRVAATIVQGVHGRRRKGTGETFWEYRRFSREDPAFRIDWRQSAKSDSLYVRENEWEAAQAAWFWIDNSPSMHYKSLHGRVSKYERALVLGLACASLLLQAGERIADLNSDEPPRHGARALEILADRLLSVSDAGNREQAVISLPPNAAVGPYGDIVLVGDFFVDLEDLTRRFEDFANRQCRLHLAQVIDPSEEDWPFKGRTRFVGVEEDLSFLAGDADQLREAYQERFKMHREYLRSLCSSHGWSFHAHRTDHSPQSALLALFMSLSDAAGMPAQTYGGF